MCSTILPICPAASAKFPSAQAELGRQWNTQNSSQPNPIHEHLYLLSSIFIAFLPAQFYGAPTAIRLLLRYDEDFVKRYDRSSLRTLGSVGEPINHEAWHWFNDVVGDGRCVHDLRIDELMNCRFKFFAK